MTGPRPGSDETLSDLAAPAPPNPDADMIIGIVQQMLSPRSDAFAILTTAADLLGMTGPGLEMPCPPMHASAEERAAAKHALGIWRERSAAGPCFWYFLVLFGAQKRAMFGVH